MADALLDIPFMEDAKPRPRWVIHAAYGRTVEEIARCDQAIHLAHRRKDYSEIGKLFQERDEWIAYSETVPKWVQQ